MEIVSKHDYLMMISYVRNVLCLTGKSAKYKLIMDDNIDNNSGQWKLKKTNIILLTSVWSKSSKEDMWL